MAVNLLALYSFNGGFPQPLPDRIRMPDGSTRTNKSSFTHKELLIAGWREVPPKPEHNPYQQVIWANNAWHIADFDHAKYQEEWIKVRNKRDKAIKDVEWRVSRYLSEIRMGREPTDDIVKLDEYIQALRDITKQKFVMDIIWPELDYYEPENDENILSDTNYEDPNILSDTAEEPNILSD